MKNQNSLYLLVAAVIVVAVVLASLFVFKPAEPTPQPTQTPSPSPTQSPNASPLPTQSPTTSPTPSPTPTVTPTPTATPTQNQTLTYDFEDGLDEWTPDSHLPAPVDWNVTVVSNVSSTGNHSALLYIDGRQDDGTVWIEHKLSLEPNSTRNVNVTFSFWSPSESFNTMAAVVGYIGTENPSTEGDFQVLGAADQVAGWKTYSIASEVHTDASGEIYVALGLSVRWETQLTYNIDDIVITIN
jgi:hypothetical protein